MLATKDSLLLVSLLCLFIANPTVHAISIAESEIEFSGGRNSFDIRRDAQHFEIKDKMGSRSLKIRPCNQAIVKKFWASVIENVKGMQTAKQSKTKAPSKLQAATLRFEKVEMPVLETDPALKFFRHVPDNSNDLFIQSLRLCKNK